MNLEKIQNGLVIEDDFRVEVSLVLPFILEHDREEVDKSQN